MQVQRRPWSVCTSGETPDTASQTPWHRAVKDDRHFQNASGRENPDSWRTNSLIPLVSVSISTHEWTSQPQNVVVSCKITGALRGLRLENTDGGPTSTVTVQKRASARPEKSVQSSQRVRGLLKVVQKQGKNRGRETGRKNQTCALVPYPPCSGIMRVPAPVPWLPCVGGDGSRECHPPQGSDLTPPLLSVPSTPSFHSCNLSCLSLSRCLCPNLTWC